MFPGALNWGILQQLGEIILSLQSLLSFTPQYRELVPKVDPGFV